MPRRNSTICIAVKPPFNKPAEGLPRGLRIRGTTQFWPLRWSVSRLTDSACRLIKQQIFGSDVNVVKEKISDGSLVPVLFNQAVIIEFSARGLYVVKLVENCKEQGRKQGRNLKSRRSFCRDGRSVGDYLWLGLEGDTNDPECGTTF
jgi:hypothetical protein